MLILNYHRVGWPPLTAKYRGMFVSPAILQWQMRLLMARGIKFYTVSAGVALGCPANAVAVTFDDGYTDNIELGLPVLQSLNIPATVYVVTKDVGQRHVVWPESGDPVPSDLMSWDQLKTLQNAGWEIGSHASDHVHLARRSLDVQRAIISQSWQDFKSNLGHPPQSFAYPYGSYNADTLSVLKELRCMNAVTIAKDSHNDHSTSSLELYRQPAKGHGLRYVFKSINYLWKL